MEITHLLIVGAPRSGTTLLTSMLGRHAEIAMLNEHRGQAIGQLTGKRVAGNKLGIPPQGRFEDARSPAARLGRRAFLWRNRLLLRRVLWPLGIHGDLLMDLDDYLALDPLRVLAILREPDAAVDSVVRRGGRTRAYAEAQWTEANALMRRMKDRLGEAMLVFAYERLTTAPEAHMRAACAFLDLPYDPRMLEGHRFNPFYKGHDGIHPQRREAPPARVSRADYEALLAQAFAPPGAEAAGA